MGVIEGRETAFAGPGRGIPIHACQRWVTEIVVASQQRDVGRNVVNSARAAFVEDDRLAWLALKEPFKQYGSDVLPRTTMKRPAKECESHNPPMHGLGTGRNGHDVERLRNTMPEVSKWARILV
jgi:hypothetical protein